MFCCQPVIVGGLITHINMEDPTFKQLLTVLAHFFWKCAKQTSGCISWGLVWAADESTSEYLLWQNSGCGTESKSTTGFVPVFMLMKYLVLWFRGTQALNTIHALTPKIYIILTFSCASVCVCARRVWTQYVLVYYGVIHLPRHRASSAAGHTSKQSQMMWWDINDENGPPGIQTSSVTTSRTRPLTRYTHSRATPRNKQTLGEEKETEEKREWKYGKIKSSGGKLKDGEREKMGANAKKKRRDEEEDQRAAGWREKWVWKQKAEKGNMVIVVYFHIRWMFLSFFILSAAVIHRFLSVAAGQRRGLRACRSVAGLNPQTELTTRIDPTMTGLFCLPEEGRAGRG